MKNKSLRLKQLTAFFLVFAFALPVFAQNNQTMKNSSNSLATDATVKIAV